MIPIAAPPVRSRAAYVRAIAFVAVVVCAACGGGSSSPASPSPSPPSVPVSNSCSAIGIAIVNGVTCSTAASPVVLVNMRGPDGVPIGSCSGTVIASRAVLTAAHCLAGSVGSVRIYLGSGPEVIARSFSAYPGYRESDPAGLDVGVVLMSDDLGRAPVPVLLSRDARVGETAILAGWGNDQNQVASTLRAGSTTITAVGSTQLQTQYSATASSVCSGDSGGPLLLQENSVWAVAGITSAVTTTACSFGTNYFANVRNANITSFILDQVPDAARR
jgi:secreted trypsin-like serine protease